jgi:hypothetical protein
MRGSYRGGITCDRLDARQPGLGGVSVRVTALAPRVSRALSWILGEIQVSAERKSRALHVLCDV